jgi:hypothetical protein
MTVSSTTTTSTGVLQGGTLAPLQFTYYINSLLDAHFPGTHILYAYADDIAFLCVAVTTTQLHNKTQKALNSLLCRLDDLQCTVSLTKTKLLTFNCKIPHLQYKNHKIQHVKQHRILGIQIDKTLTFNTHVQTIVKKANQALQWLKTIATSFQIHRRRTLALQYALSIIDYSLLTIYPYLSPSNHKKLNTLISKAARFILQVPQSVSTPFVILEAHLQNIHDRAKHLAITHYRNHIHHDTLH